MPVTQRGVKTISKSGDTPLKQDVTLSAGTNVTLTQAGQNIAIASDVPDYNGVNLLKNGNFINNSTNGYGSTADDWTNSNGNPVQGGFPTMTKAELISITGVADGDIEGLWNLNEASGDATDLSANGYNLTDTNTVTNDADGLMSGGARKFTAANTEYLTIANAASANLKITGSQTLFCLFKSSTLSDETIFSTNNATNNGGIIMYIQAADKAVVFVGRGLTTNTVITSDVKLEANKWYFIVGEYDSVNTALSLTINGVKKAVTASGTVAASTADPCIGYNLSGTNLKCNGSIQAVGLLSVALTDAQVKRLWAATTYKGQKIRRATDDSTYYQALNEDLAERLRGKAITLRAAAYCSSTNHGIYITTNGTGGTTTVDNPSSANAWEDLSVSITVPADATAITVGLTAPTTDGNSWFKALSLYEGTEALPYSHSLDDWSRFPRLLKMDIPQMYNGLPYQYEEKRYFSWTPVVTASAAMTIASLSITQAKWMYTGQNCSFVMKLGFTTGVNDDYDVYTTMPLYRADAGAYVIAGNGNGYGAAVAVYGQWNNTSQTQVGWENYNQSLWTLGASGSLGGLGHYDID